MSLQPPREPSYLVVPQTFFPSQFHYQNHNQIQPYFVNHQLQTYVCNPFYYVYPSHPFPNVQRPPNPPLNPKVVPPPPRRNIRSRPTRNLTATTSRRRRIWVPKRKEDQASTSVRSNRPVQDGSSGIPFPKSLHLQITPAITTLMIKNIPNQFGRSDLLGVLKDHCLDENIKTVLRCEPAKKSEFDFLYLPMDFKEFEANKRISNLGYAFVNFTTSDAVLRFCKQYHNFKWPVSKNKKICEITRAETQGKDALVRRFKKKIFWCHSNEYLPVILAPPCDGVKNSGLVTVGELAGKPKIYRKK